MRGFAGMGSPVLFLRLSVYWMVCLVALSTMARNASSYSALIKLTESPLSVPRSSIALIF